MRKRHTSLFVRIGIAGALAGMVLTAGISLPARAADAMTISEDRVPDRTPVKVVVTYEMQGKRSTITVDAVRVAGRLLLAWSPPAGSRILDMGIIVDDPTPF